MSRKEEEKYLKSGQPYKDEDHEELDLREKIRKMVEERMTKYGNHQLDAKGRKQLRDDVKRQLNASKSSNKEKANIIERLTSNFKKSLESAMNFIDPLPGPSRQYSVEDYDPEYEEQLELAMSMSRMMMEPIHTDIEPSIDDRVHDQGAVNIECAICMEITTEPMSYGCEHQFCGECIVTNLNTAISDGLIESMKCPDPECEQNATEPMVRRLVSQEMYERYETLQLKAAVAGMDNIAYCSNGDCGAIIEIEAEGFATCYKCGHTFCTNCSKPYHGTSDCELTDIERQQMMQLYQDELIAETEFQEESINQLAIEVIQREEEEWLKQIREEQQAIRIQEELEKEEMDRIQEENRRVEAENARAEAEEQERQRIEHERIVQQNQEKERQDNVRREGRRRQDRESENTIRSTTKPCPRCKSPIEKNAGCIHMTCTKCSYQFCWGCMGDWQGNHHTCPN